MEEEITEDKGVHQGIEPTAAGDTDVSDEEGDQGIAVEEKKQTKWGEIVPLDSTKFNSYECVEKEISIGRSAGNMVLIDDKRLSGNHCRLLLIDNKAYIEDTSSNGTYVFNKKIGKGLKHQVESGDIVYVLHKSKVAAGDVIGFVVKLSLEDKEKEQQMKRQGLLDAQSSKELEEKLNQRLKVDEESRQQELQKLKDEHEAEKLKIQAELKKFQSQDDKIQEEIECVICMDIICSCVTLQPCLHNLCAACYYDWKQKSDECPNCRAKVVGYAKNPTMNNLIATFLTKHPEKKNKDEYYQDMEEKAKLLWNGGTGNGKEEEKKQQQKQQPPKKPEQQHQAPIVALARAAIQQQQAAVAPQNRAGRNSKPNNKNICRECKDARDDDGFQCSENTPHVTCNACKKPFPDRSDECDNQKCTICELFFCNIYTKTCKQKRFLLAGNYLERIRDFTPPGYIPQAFFKGNQVESRAFSQYLTIKKMSTQNLFEETLNKEMKAGKFFYEISPKWDPAEKNTKRIQIRDVSAVCKDCFVNKLWFQIVVNYRIKVAKELPPPYNNRDKCWYGLNCRTQNSEQHAKKLDHVCEQTKF